MRAAQALAPKKTCRSRREGGKHRPGHDDPRVWTARAWAPVKTCWGGCEGGKHHPGHSDPRAVSASAHRGTGSQDDALGQVRSCDHLGEERTPLPGEHESRHPDIVGPQS